MAKRKICQAMAVVLALGMCTTGLTGCGNEKRADGKTEIEVVSYKPEACLFQKVPLCRGTFFCVRVVGQN